MRGRREGKQGGRSDVPHRGRRLSPANSLPFPEHQRSHCYQLLFWPQQKTPEPRVEGYFHDRTKAFCPGTEEPRKRTCHANPCGGVGSPHWLCPCSDLCWYLPLLGLQGFTVECTMSRLTYCLPLAPFHGVTCPA